MKKFLFETSFDACDGLVLTGGKRRVARSPGAYSEADLKAARDKAFDQGKAAGLNEAQASIESRTAQALAKIGERLAAGDPGLEAAIDAIKRDAVEAALTVVRKVMPEFSRRRSLDEIESLVTHCLEGVLGEPRVVIRAHDSLLDSLREHIDSLAEHSGYSGKIVLLAEPDMPESDCRVEWADGGAERNSNRVWEEIDGAIARFLAVLDQGHPGGGASRPATTGPTGVRGGHDEAPNIASPDSAIGNAEPAAGAGDENAAVDGAGVGGPTAKAEASPSEAPAPGVTQPRPAVET